MSEVTGWQRFFPLFLRHGLLPEPGEVKRLREELARELAEMESKSSQAAGVRNAAEWAALKRQREEDMIAEIEAARLDIRNYPEWAPTGEDWMRLAIGLAIKHEEPEFAFKAPETDETAEQNWHRDRLLGAIMAADKLPADAAAEKAETYIAKQQAEGRGLEYGRRFSADYLKGGFAARNRARRDGRAPDKKYRSKRPAHLDFLLFYQEHFVTILEEARALSQPEVD